MELPILHVTGLTMDFGGVRALNNLDLDVNEGEIVALIGPNGAGKTTFFNCVTVCIPDCLQVCLPFLKIIKVGTP